MNPLRAAYHQKFIVGCRSVMLHKQQTRAVHFTWRDVDQATARLHHHGVAVKHTSLEPRSFSFRFFYGSL
jgi:hypothetical protein